VGAQTAALILAWFQKTDDLSTVMENAVATVQVPGVQGVGGMV